MNCGVKSSVTFPVLQRSPQPLEYDKPHYEGKTAAGFCTTALSGAHWEPGSRHVSKCTTVHFRLHERRGQGRKC